MVGRLSSRHPISAPSAGAHVKMVSQGTRLHGGMPLGIPEEDGVEPVLTCARPVACSRVVTKESSLLHRIAGWLCQSLVPSAGVTPPGDPSESRCLRSRPTWVA
jgi:hypothetical protein